MPTSALGLLDHQELDLAGMQLLGWSLTGDALILDLWGGSGHWRGYARGAWMRSARVVQPPALALRASAATLDLDLCDRLDHLVASGRPLVVHVAARGPGILEDVGTIDITDGIDVVAFTGAPSGPDPTSSSDRQDRAASGS